MTQNNMKTKTIPATYESPKVEEMTLEIEGAILSFSNNPYEDDGSLPF